MKRAKQYYQQLPKAVKGIANLCFSILIFILAVKLISPLLLFAGELIYRFGKSTLLFVFPDMSHDAKIIILVIGLFLIPLVVMFFTSALSKRLNKIKKESIQ